MVVGTRWTGLRISETVNLMGFSHNGAKIPFRVTVLAGNSVLSKSLEDNCQTDLGYQEV